MTDDILLVIDDPHIEALAARVAELRGLPVEEALEKALELDVQRLEAEKAAKDPLKGVASAVTPD